MKPEQVGDLDTPRQFTRPVGVWVDPSRWRRATAVARLSPSFLIIGAQRSGTTSLFNYLSTHPRILPPLRKEVHYFDFQYTKGLAWYLAHFPFNHRPWSKKRHITGEASPYYMVHPMAPARVRDFNQDMKLIAILRDPVDRAFSHYQLERSNGAETLTFEEGLAAEPERLASHQHFLRQAPYYYSYNHHHFSYLDRGRYGHYLKMWLDHFPVEQMLVLNTRDMFVEPNRVANEVFAFLDLPAHEPRAPAVFNERSYQPVDCGSRNRMERYYREDRQLLETVLRSVDGTAPRFGHAAEARASVRTPPGRTA